MERNSNSLKYIVVKIVLALIVIGILLSSMLIISNANILTDIQPEETTITSITVNIDEIISEHFEVIEYETYYSSSEVEIAITMINIVIDCGK